MKNMRLNSIMAGGVLLLGMYGCTPKVQDYSSYVNSFIGTWTYLSRGYSA